MYNWGRLLNFLRKVRKVGAELVIQEMMRALALGMEREGMPLC